MKLDDLLNKAPILAPPDSIKTKVMESVGEEFEVRDDSSSQPGVDTRFFFNKRTIVSFAAMAAALLLAFRVFPGSDVTTVPEQVASVTAHEAIAPDDKIDEFVEDALSQVFGAEPGVDVVYDDEPTDFDTYISNQLEEIFWINGGNNA
jgi:hypothetical protein